MVESVRTTGIGPATALSREGDRAPEVPFSIDDGATVPSRPSRLATTTAIDLEGMLALQAVDETDERDRGARRRAGMMISGLTRLQRAILAGQGSDAALRELENICREGLDAADPRLTAVLRAITLRTRVELARRRKATEGG